MSAAGTVETLPPATLREAVAALWAIPPPGPENIYYAPEFVRVREVCKTLYPEACAGSGLVLDFALSDALDALGAPCRPPPADPRLTLPPEIAAGRLHAAFRQSEIRGVYLCPLDRADRLPDLTFGPNRIAKLTAAELEKLIDWLRHKRVNAGWMWRAFEVPREHATHDDLFVRPKGPPSADTLSWVDGLGDDGEQVFFDPAPAPLKIGGASVSDWLNDRRWADLMTVEKNQLFQSPVKHFFVKAFLEEPVDEFLAHITTIDAALLLEHERRGLTTSSLDGYRPSSDNRAKAKSTSTFTT